MKSLLITLACLFSVYGFTNTHRFQDLYNTLKPIMEDCPDKAQLSLGFVKNDEVIFVGLQKTQNGVIQVSNQDSIFEIGHLTTVFTSVVLSNYVQSGRISLDDMVKDYASIDMKQKYTFKQLANHHSGIDRNPMNMLDGDWNPNNPFADYTDEMIREFFSSKYKVYGKPGERYHFSNAGYGLLGFTLSRLDQIPIEELINKMIFEKYGMAESSLQYERNHRFMVNPYNGLGKTTNYWTFKSSMAAAGGMQSSTADMVKFLQAHFNKDNTELLMCTEKTASIKEGEDIGLGWRILSEESAHPILVADGKTAGFSSAMALDVRNNIGVVILSNQVTSDINDVIIDIIK